MALVSGLYASPPMALTHVLRDNFKIYVNADRSPRPTLESSAQTLSPWREEGALRGIAN